jgi:hypothetical protein
LSHRVGIEVLSAVILKTVDCDTMPVVCRKLTDVSEDHAASIFITGETGLNAGSKFSDVLLGLYLDPED